MTEVNNKQESRKASFFLQMEKCLLDQKVKCDYYQKVFEEQNNATLADKFKTFADASVKDLDLLRVAIKCNDKLPAFKFEQVNFNCLPINTDIREKELQIAIKTNNLATENNALIYVVAEFEFPTPKEEPIGDSFARWWRSVEIEPQNFFCCAKNSSRQLDIIHSTDFVPFTSPRSTMLEFDRPFSFYVDKGKSRTLKRKFKPVKLTFYEKTSFLRQDIKLGTTQVKIDAINDQVQVSMRQNIMNGRKQLEAVADIKIRVREPLANKAIRPHEEKFLLLTFE